MKTLIISFIFAVISLLFCGLVIYPQFSQIKKGSEDLVSAKKTLVVFQSEIKNLEQFKEIYKTLSPGLTIMEGLFVDPKFPLDFIEFLEKIGADSKVPIDVAPLTLPKQEADPWPSMGFQISLVGPLPNCLRFFEKIEAVPYLLEIQNFSAKRLGKEGAEGDATVNLAIKVFTR